MGVSMGGVFLCNILSAFSDVLDLCCNGPGNPAAAYNCKTATLLLSMQLGLRYLAGRLTHYPWTIRGPPNREPGTLGRQVLRVRHISRCALVVAARVV